LSVGKGLRAPNGGWGVGPSFRAPVDDLGRGLDFEGWPGAGERRGAVRPSVTPKCEGRVTPRAGGVVGGSERGAYGGEARVAGQRPAGFFFWGEAVRGAGRGLR